MRVGCCTQLAGSHLNSINTDVTSGESANTKPPKRLFFYIKLPLGGFFIEVNMNATELRKILDDHNVG